MEMLTIIMMHSRCVNVVQFLDFRKFCFLNTPVQRSGMLRAANGEYYISPEL